MTYKYVVKKFLFWLRCGRAGAHPQHTRGCGGFKQRGDPTQFRFDGASELPTIKVSEHGMKVQRVFGNPPTELKLQPISRLRLQ